MKDRNLPRAIALGYFDGVHLGHKALMDRAVFRAKEIGGISSVFTFDQHPSYAVSGIHIPMLSAKATRADEIKRLGNVDEVIFGHFDDHLRTMDWKDFIHELLIKKFGAKYIISGENNRFGYRGLGTSEGMAEECKKAGIGYDCIKDVKIDGIVVSSTYIRELIAKGEMERAAKFLGHPYTICGVVEHGRNVGTKTLGVPTLNIPIPKEMALPPYGVYATLVEVGGKTYKSVTNIGIKPTFEDAGKPTIEPHLLDFDGDLYGKFINVKFYKFLRPEKAFSDINKLKDAIMKNIQQTREYFK